MIGVIHQAAIGPFKVPQQGQGLTHAAVGQDRVVEVEHKPLSTLNGQGRQTFFLQAPVIQCCAVIGGGKLRRRTDRIEVEHPGAQGLDIDAAVIGKVFDAHLIKVVLATVDRQVGAPPVRHPLQMHTAPRVNLDHAIRPAAGRDIKTRAIGKVVLTPPVRWQDRQGRDVQRQSAVIAADEVKAHLQWRLDHHPGDVGKLNAVLQFAVGGQLLEGVAHIVGGDGRAVVKPGLRVEGEADPAVVRRQLHALRDIGIHRVGFIFRALGQRRIKPAIEFVHALPLVHIRQQMIKGRCLPGQAEAPAFGGIGLHIVKVLKIGRVFRRFAVNRQRLLWLGMRQRRAQQQQPCTVCESFKHGRRPLR